MRWGIYARLSRDLEDAASIDRQLEAGRERARQLGATEIIEYTDSGISAYNKNVKRPEFERLLTDIRSGRIAAVTAWKVDRVARQLSDGERFLDAVRGRARVEFIADPLREQLGTADGEFMLNFFVLLAKRESQNIAARVRSAKVQKKAEGRFLGGPVGWGHNANRTELVAEQAQALKDATRRILAGESIKSILRDWKRRGITTNAGTDFQHTALKNLLLSPRLIGTAHIPAIITEAEQKQLRHLLDKRKHGYGSARKHLLSGILRCGKCQRPMIARSHTGREARTLYYECRKDFGAGCGRTAIFADKTEEHIAGLVVQFLEQNAEGLARHLSPPDKTWVAEARADLQARREGLAEREREYLSKTLPASTETFIKWRNDEIATIDSIERQLAENDDYRLVTRAVRNPERFWNKADLDQRRSLIRIVFLDVQVGPAVSSRWKAERVVTTYRPLDDKVQRTAAMLEGMGAL